MLKQTLLRLGKRVPVAVAIIGALAATSVQASDASHRQLTRAELAQVMKVHKLDESQAVRRMSAEAIASDVYRGIRTANLPGYAGAWLDTEALQLVVATNRSADFAKIEYLGGSPLLVKWSLADLQALKHQIVRGESPELAATDWLESYVDQIDNRVVIVVSTGEGPRIRALLAEHGDRVYVEESDRTFEFTTDLPGAVGTVNDSWDGLPPLYVYPCSVGIATIGGFYTAAHCGGVNDVIHIAGGGLLGEVDTSNLPFNTVAAKTDAGWVDVASGWTPVAEIEGYSDGTIPVPAKWGGYSELFINGTVCRYGDTSGGPHCGDVDALDVDVTGNGGVKIADLTRVDGSCSNNGDSGGPFLALSDYQAQGTVTGASTTGTCPTDTTYVYFQPFADHQDLIAKTILTSHGANDPTQTGLDCPESDIIQTYGTWSCRIDWYNTQGPVTVSWSTGTPTNETRVSGTCQAGFPHSVTLTLTNAYGSDNWPSNFTCPN